MAKSLYIAEKPSVAREFASALKVAGRSNDGYIESQNAIVTWCVGHLVTMSYPEVYDIKYKRWSLQTLPFLPKEFKYQVIESVEKQFKIVSGLLNRPDVDTIYVCTDSGREGEYIYRLVAQMAGVKGKKQKRVWIDSQTEEEILRGIREAKDLEEYDNLAASAYLRAKEDYLMGINFSRALTLKYGPSISNYMKTDRTVISVGRVMTCVMGMVVRREREIRDFVRTPFYRVIGTFGPEGITIDGEWRAVPGSQYYGTPCLYKENGFKERKDAEGLIAYLIGTEVHAGTEAQARTQVQAETQVQAGTEVQAETQVRIGTEAQTETQVQTGTEEGATGAREQEAAIGLISAGNAEHSEGKQNRQADQGESAEASGRLGESNGTGNTGNAQDMGGADMNRFPASGEATIASIEKKKETKNPPLLYNLAELQNDCSKMFKISPDQTLKVVQELYEKKLVTYPRTDARVLSTAVAKEINKNINGLTGYGPTAEFAREALASGSWKTIAKTRYVNDKQITDHYAIIPTGQGLGALRSLSELNSKIYQVIVRRFLSIFFPPAIYQKYAVEIVAKTEHFFASFKVLKDPGYLKVADVPGKKNRAETAETDGNVKTGGGRGKDGRESSDKLETAEKAEPDNSAGGDTVIDASNPEFIGMLEKLKKGTVVSLDALTIKEGETSPPKRYTSGSMILAMENAGQLIEDEELRAQIKGSGIGTSATRAEILKKLFNIKYLALNNKTQVIMPTFLGELIFEVVDASIRQLLNPELTASWEKGLTYVAEGSITSDEYMQKLERFVTGRTYNAVHAVNQYGLRPCFDRVSESYTTAGGKAAEVKMARTKKGAEEKKTTEEKTHPVLPGKKPGLQA